MPGKDSDTNSRILWKAIFVNSSAGTSSHRSTQPGHRILEKANFNIQDQSIGASLWKSWWEGFHVRTQPFTVRSLGANGEGTTYRLTDWLHVSAPCSTERWCKMWKRILTLSGSVEQSLLGNVGYLVENCLCKLLAGRSIIWCPKESVGLKASCHWIFEYGKKEFL